MEKYLELKEKIAQAVKENLQDAIALNDDLADHPELSGEEYESSRKIVELLKRKGFDVEYPFAGLPTSFKATYGRNDHKYKVAIMTEYDALPGIGHACGHCVSGAISVLAGIAASKLQDALDNSRREFSISLSRRGSFTVQLASAEWGETPAWDMMFSLAQQRL